MHRDESQQESWVDLPAQLPIQPQTISQPIVQPIRQQKTKPQKGSYWQRQKRSSGGKANWGTAKPLGNWMALLKNLSFLTASSLSLVTVLVVLGMMRSGTDFMGKIFGVVTAPQPDPKVDVRSAVVQQVRGVSELTTAVFAMQTVVPTSRERTVGGFVVGKTTLLYIGYGEVRAGLDLSSLTADAVQTQGDTLMIRLPPPRILDSKLDVNRSQVYDYDRGFMGMGPDVAPELQELAQRKTLDSLVQSACNEGLLQTANDRARLAVGQLLSTSGYDQVTIETQSPAGDACPLPGAVPEGASLPPVPVTPSP